MKLTNLLNEISIKELIDLNNREQNPFTPKIIKYKALAPKSKTAYFKTGKYIQKIRFPEITAISRLKGDEIEKIKMALDGNIKVHCTCHDFLYGGFKYIAWTMDYGIEKEIRRPDIRNPKEDGTVCKHLVYLLNHIDNHVNDIANDFIAARKTRKNIYH